MGALPQVDMHVRPGQASLVDVLDAMPPNGVHLCFVAGLDLIEMEIQPSEDHGFDAVAIKVRP